MNHNSEILKSVVKKFGKVHDVKEIWEIGSRDGLDSQAMSEVFTIAKITAFEPNPDTFNLVKEVSAASHGRIHGSNSAISDYDGDITFYKIDTAATVTSWIDGNPGASSMFVAKQSSDIPEKYVQIPIKVQSWRAQSLIEQQEYPIPNLIWIDVQGSEILVLKGFGRYLQKVDYIYVELTLKELYQGQALIGDVVKILSKNFFWHSNLTKGSWQIDGLFLNKRYKTGTLQIRNFFLNMSLKYGLKIGIEFTFRQFLKKQIRKPGKGIYKLLLSILRRNESQILANIFTNIYLSVSRTLNIKKVSSRMRPIISLVQTSDPIKDKILPVIDIAIPCNAKDFDNLFLVINGVMANVKNPIGKIYLITPASFAIDLQAKFPECEVLTDEVVLGPDIISIINNCVPGTRRGWILQQAIKFRITLISENIATLIIDADTILLSKKAWLDSTGNQILCIGDEYHLPYKNHQLRMFGGQNYPLSFVTHHQLMKKDCVLEIFGGGEGLIRWLNLGDYNESSAISEYDTYGEWMMLNRPKDIVFSKWNNKSLKINLDQVDYTIIVKDYGKYCSISNHSYL